MAALTIDGKAIIPAPLIEIKRNPTRAGNGNLRLGETVSITLTGTLVAWKGSPSSSGTFYTGAGYPADESVSQDSRLASLLAKQKALCDLLGDGKVLEIQPWDGSAATSYSPRYLGITFQPGPWVDRVDYTANFEADAYPDRPGYAIADANEQWALEQADDKGRTFRLTHEVSAVGRTVFDETGAVVSGAYQLARQYVLGRLGLGFEADKLYATGVLNLGDLSPYNYARTQSLNEVAGSFSVQETWLAVNASGEAPAVEDFTVNVRADEAGRTSVSVEGQIQGLEQRNNQTHTLTTTRYANALSKWENNVYPILFTRAQNMSGTTLNPTPVGTSVGHNEWNGVITYTHAYDNRPTSAIAGAVTESVVLNDTNAADVFAAIPVLGRSAGPVLQDIQTTTAKKRSISIEAALPSKSQSYSPSKPDTDALVASYAPTGLQVFVEGDSESWGVYTGRYSRQTQWVWQ